jgi:hypothetical protein
MFVLIFYQIIMDFVVLYESLCQVKLKLKLTPFFVSKKITRASIHALLFLSWLFPSHLMLQSESAQGEAAAGAMGGRGGGGFRGRGRGMRRRWRWWAHRIASFVLLILVYDGVFNVFINWTEMINLNVWYFESAWLFYLKVDQFTDW